MYLTIHCIRLYDKTVLLYIVTSCLNNFVERTSYYYFLWKTGLGKLQDDFRRFIKMAEHCMLMKALHKCIASDLKYSYCELVFWLMVHNTSKAQSIYDLHCVSSV